MRMKVSMNATDPITTVKISPVICALIASLPWASIKGLFSRLIIHSTIGPMMEPKGINIPERALR